MFSVGDVRLFVDVNGMHSSPMRRRRERPTCDAHGNGDHSFLKEDYARFTESATIVADGGFLAVKRF